MNPSWKDDTSYSRGERGVREPDAWELRLNQSGLRIVVFRPRWDRETWVFSAYWRGGSVFSEAELRTGDLDEAKRLAVEKALSLFESVSGEVRALTSREPA